MSCEHFNFANFENDLQNFINIIIIMCCCCIWVRWEGKLQSPRAAERKESRVTMANRQIEENYCFDHELQTLIK